MNYVDQFRDVHEHYASFAWAIGGLALVATAAISPMPTGPSLLLAAGALAASVHRGLQASRLWKRQKRLAGFELEHVTLATVHEHLTARPDAVWMGYGFAWGQAEAQRLYDLTSHHSNIIAALESDVKIGQRWIHGMGETEEAQYNTLKANEGHRLIAGTSGAGKTRMMDHLISASIMRNAPVIIIDPKNDEDLQRAAKATCEALGQGDRFKMFHVALPAQSCRFDPLRNWNRETELPNRIAKLMPATADNFSAFAQMALKTITSGLLIAGVKPSLSLIYRYMVGEPEALLIQACSAYFRKHVSDYEKTLASFEKSEQENPRRGENSPTAARARAFIRYYREKVQPRVPSSDLEGLITFCESNKEWRSKMLGGLMPVLDALTAGHLGKLLSPDYADANDKRPIIDFQTVVDNRLVLYVALDSLSDQVTGSAIGSLMISDLTAVAGAEMNYGKSDSRREVYIFIDEVNELANDPLVQLLNKSRGAGFRLTLALQSIFSDLAARMGNEHKASQVLDNVNNLVVFRIGNPETRKRISEHFGEVMIKTVVRSQSNSTSSDDPTKFSGSASESEEEERLPLVPQEVLGKIPTLEYFAWNAGGRIVKGRLPILEKHAVALPAGAGASPTQGAHG